MALKSKTSVNTITFGIKYLSEQTESHINPSRSPSSDITGYKTFKVERDNNDAISISSNEEDKEVSNPHDHPRTLTYAYANYYNDL